MSVGGKAGVKWADSDVAYRTTALEFQGGPAGNRTRMIGLEDQPSAFIAVQARPAVAWIQACHRWGVWWRPVLSDQYV